MKLYSSKDFRDCMDKVESDARAIVIAVWLIVLVCLFSVMLVFALDKTAEIEESKVKRHLSQWDGSRER